jgi:hypothetical protein
MSTFSDFLLRRTVKPDGVLPLAHTTRAYHLKKIKETDKIVPRRCDVFTTEDLSYFFVGRPAYKYESDGSEAEYWELPCCFIFEFSSVRNVRRIFPFDSGAFTKGRYPPYIKKMDLNIFEASAAPNAVSRIIGAFFGDAASYFSFNSKDRKKFESEFGLDVFDAELRALHRLSLEKSPASFDDRRFSIEVQTPDPLDLTVIHPLAVIAPHMYYEKRDFRRHVETKWACLPIGYPVYSLSSDGFYYAVYERVETFFKSKGYL